MNNIHANVLVAHLARTSAGITFIIIYFGIESFFLKIYSAKSTSYLKQKWWTTYMQMSLSHIWPGHQQVFFLTPLNLRSAELKRVCGLAVYFGPSNCPSVRQKLWRRQTDGRIKQSFFGHWLLYDRSSQKLNSAKPSLFEAKNNEQHTCKCPGSTFGQDISRYFFLTPLNLRSAELKRVCGLAVYVRPSNCPSVR